MGVGELVCAFRRDEARTEPGGRRGAEILHCTHKFFHACTNIIHRKGVPNHREVGKRPIPGSL